MFSYEERHQNILSFWLYRSAFNSALTSPAVKFAIGRQHVHVIVSGADGFSGCSSILLRSRFGNVIVFDGFDGLVLVNGLDDYCMVTIWLESMSRKSFKRLVAQVKP